MTQALAAMKMESTADAGLARWTGVCGSRECETGWLQLFRSRSLPRFEGKWACSTGCMERIVADAVRSQMESWEPDAGGTPTAYAIGPDPPQPWMDYTSGAPGSARGTAPCRRWPHRRVARTPAWHFGSNNCKGARVSSGTAQYLRSVMPGTVFAPSLIPAFVCWRYGLALLRQRQDEVFYLAGKYCADHAALARRRAHAGRPVQAVFLEDSAWSSVASDAADSVETDSGRDGIVTCIAELVERSRPANARLVRIHDHLWLRMWLRRRDRTTQIEDVVFPLRAKREEPRGTGALLRGR